MSQSIYVVGSEHGAVKIGMSGIPWSRFSDLQVGSPTPLRMHYVANTTGGEAAAIEILTHSILSDRHVSGEWFRVEPSEAVDAIKQAANELGITLGPIEKPQAIPREGPRKTSATSLRLTPETKAALKRAAEGERRSTSDIVDRALVMWLQQNGYLPKPKKPRA